MQERIALPRDIDVGEVAFRCLKNGQFHRIGYVVSEIVDHVHASFQSDLVTDVLSGSSGWSRIFCSDKLGRWPIVVVRAAST